MPPFRGAMPFHYKLLWAYKLIITISQLLLVILGIDEMDVDLVSDDPL